MDLVNGNCIIFRFQSNSGSDHSMQPFVHASRLARNAPLLGCDPTCANYQYNFQQTFASVRSYRPHPSYPWFFCRSYSASQVGSTLGVERDMDDVFEQRLEYNVSRFLRRFGRRCRPLRRSVKSHCHLVNLQLTVVIGTDGAIHVSHFSLVHL